MAGGIPDWLDRHGDELVGGNYTLYLEHLGGFLPILKGRKTSKLKPEFVIFDPMKGWNCGISNFRKQVCKHTLDALPFSLTAFCFECRDHQTMPRNTTSTESSWPEILS